MLPKLRYSLPAALLDEADRELDVIEQVKLFNDSQYQKLREKWCAAKFGVGYEKFLRPCLVAVNDTTERLDADFFVRTDGKEFPFQLAEVQEPERRRGD